MLSIETQGILPEERPDEMQRYDCWNAVCGLINLTLTDGRRAIQAALLATTFLFHRRSNLRAFWPPPQKVKEAQIVFIELLLAVFQNQICFIHHASLQNKPVYIIEPNNQWSSIQSVN